MEIHALDSGTGSTFAKIVKAHHQGCTFPIRKQGDVAAVGAVARLKIEGLTIQDRFVSEREHADKFFAGVRVSEDLMQLRRLRPGGELAEREGEREEQPPVKIRDDRHKNGRRSQAGVRRHLGQMLVPQSAFALRYYNNGDFVFASSIIRGDTPKNEFNKRVATELEPFIRNALRNAIVVIGT